MIAYLRNNVQFISMLLSWVIVGVYGGPISYAVIPFLLFLLWRNQQYEAIFLGFLFILVLSDSLQDGLVFAKSFKNINILLIAFFVFADQKTFSPFNGAWKLFVPYLIIATYCLIYSGPNFNTGIQKTLSYALLFFAVPNYISALFRMHGKEFLRDMLFFLLTIIVVGYLIRFYNSEIAYSHGGRFRGLFGNPNGLGIFLILVFLYFSITDHLYPDLYSRNEKWFFYLVIFYAVIRTGSRSALLAILFYLLFIRVYKISPFLGFIVFLASLLATEFFLQYYVVIIKSLGLDDLFRVDTLEGGSGRLIAWAFAWEHIQKSIFLGKGMAYDEYLMRSNFDYLSKLGHEGGVHNTYLIIWLNTGLVGLLAFLRGFILLFIKGSKNTPIAIPAMFAVMFSINFEPWLAASLNPFTILFLTLATVLTGDDFTAQWQKIKQGNPEEPIPANDETIIPHA